MPGWKRAHAKAHKQDQPLAGTGKHHSSFGSGNRRGVWVQQQALTAPFTDGTGPWGREGGYPAGGGSNQNLKARRPSKPEPAHKALNRQGFTGLQGQEPRQENQMQMANVTGQTSRGGGAESKFWT